MHGANDEAENEISFKPTCKGVSAAVPSGNTYNSPYSPPQILTPFLATWLALAFESSANAESKIVGKSFLYGDSSV